MSRAVRILLATVVALVLTATSAGATPVKTLSSLLAALWTTTVEIPGAENPLNAGGNHCLTAPQRILIVVAGPGTDATCRVRTGTKVFISPFTVECSTAEVGTSFYGANRRALRDCARNWVGGLDTHRLSLDAKPVPLTYVETGLLVYNLPPNNVLNPEVTGRALSVAAGWVALLHPLPPGNHILALDVAGKDPDGNPLSFRSTTTIVVSPGHPRR